jgi:RimJ/RimL family protein N-acetyltransferase
MEVYPVTLTGRLLRLEPLSEVHVPDLEFTCRDEESGGRRRSIWTYLFDARLYYSEGGMRTLVRELLRRQEQGTDIPLAIIDLKTNSAVGCTRYLDVQRENWALEIATWYGLQFQRDGFNEEGKYLMLKHAFGVWGCRRVQFKIDHRNFASIDAIERIRAVKEGILRNHVLLPDASPRSSVIYSILDSEWPAVEMHLENLMLRRSG